MDNIDDLINATPLQVQHRIEGNLHIAGFLHATSQVPRRRGNMPRWTDVVTCILV